MKIFSYFSLIACISVLWISCKKDDEGTLALHFIAYYDGLPVSTFESKPFENGQNIELTHMSMFVADLALFAGSEDEHLSDVELVDLSFDNLVDAQEGFTVTINQIPARTYDGIRFGIGVPPDVNAKQPSDFSSSSPLSKTGYYWEAWSSYIFSKTEGRLDTLGNGSFDLGFAFHTGSDALYRTLEGMVPLTIEDGKATDLDIRIDYKKLLEGIDIKSNPLNHNPSDSIQIGQIVNNLATAVSLAH